MIKKKDFINNNDKDVINTNYKCSIFTLSHICDL